MAEAKHLSLADEIMQYEFTPKLKQRLTMGFLAGVLMFLIGIILLWAGIDEGGAAHGGGHALLSEGGGEAAHHEYHWGKRVLANLWLCTYYFNGIALIGVFFVAFNYVAWAGWSALIKRIPEAFGYFLPITGGLLAVLFIAQLFLGDSLTLFHWTHEGISTKGHPAYDKIIAGKSGYLNAPFFLIRMAIFFGLWIVLFRMLRNFSLQEDKITDLKAYLKNPVIYNRAVYWSAVFLVVFAVSSSIMSWDWMMSIDTHWFSTMFGWYNFASLHVAGLATITLTVIFLKEQGYLKAVSKHHLHDLGKFMFAFSVFWTYIWTSQFLLIYYAHIPEETTYFNTRLNLWDGKYFPIFFFNIFMNFVFPFLALMTKESKRTMTILKVVACAILMGHYLDFYLMIMPGTVGEHGGFGLVEIGTLTMFICAFVYVIALNLSKVPLIAKNHPMLKESMHHTQFN
jgi:hypothetical protein